MSKSLHTKRYERFRLALIEARKQNSLTQVEVAEKLGVPQSYISKVEVGERRLDIIETLDLAKAIGIDPVDLIKKLR